MIQLSKHEIRILKEALRAWEQEEQIANSMSSLFVAMLTPKEERHEGYLKKTHQTMVDESREKVSQRKDQSILLQSKLIQMENQLREHEVV